MNTSNMSNYVNACTSSVETNILVPIVNYLVNKGINVYLDELRGVLELPGTKIELPVTKTVSSPFGGALPNIVNTVKSKSKVSEVLPIIGHNCIYQFKRGENKDSYCNKATTGGAEYCNGCLKNRKNLAKSTVPGVVPSLAPLSQNNELTVVPYDQPNNLYREPTHNFIVHSSTPGIVIVIGILNDDNEIVPLTEQEKLTAKNYGLVIKEEPKIQPEPFVIPVFPTS